MSATAIRAGRAFVEFFTKNNPLKQGLANAQSLVRSAASNMQAAGTRILSATAPALVGLGASTRIFTGFDDSMRKVGARSKGTAEQLVALRNQAKELGRTTSFTAGQVAELQAKLAQKGFDRSQIKAMTEDVLALARAAGDGNEGDSVIAADLISGTLRAFKRDASEAGNVSDVYTAAVNNSNFALDGLITSMANAGPVAAQYKRGLEETVTTLAAMTNINIDPSAAGTAYRNMLLKLSDDTGRSKFNARLKEMTGSTISFIDAAGNLRALPNILFEIGDAVSTMGSAAQGDLLGDLFGLRAVVGAGAISSARDSFKELEATLNNVNGTAKATAAEMDAGIGGMFRRVMSAAEGAAIAIAETFAVELQEAGEYIGGLIGVATEWINNNKELVAWLAKTVLILAGVGAGLLAMSVALNVVSGIIGAGIFVIGALIKIVWLAQLAFTGLAFAIGALPAIIGFLLSPIGLVSVAVGGLIAWLLGAADAAAWLGTRFSEFVAAVGPAISGIIAAVQAGRIDIAFKLIWLAIQIGWNEMLSFLIQTFGGFVESIKAVVGPIFNVFSSLAQTIFGVFKSVFDWLVGAFRWVVDKLNGIFGLTKQATVEVDFARAKSLELQDQVGKLTASLEVKPPAIDKAADQLESPQATSLKETLDKLTSEMRTNTVATVSQKNSTDKAAKAVGKQNDEAMKRIREGLAGVAGFGSFGLQNRDQIVGGIDAFDRARDRAREKAAAKKAESEATQKALDDLNKRADEQFDETESIKLAAQATSNGISRLNAKFDSIGLR